MFSLRRAVVRVLSAPPPSLSLSTKARTFTSLNTPASRFIAPKSATYLPFQRRFASDEAATQAEPEADGAAGVESSSIEPPKSEEEAAAIISEGETDVERLATSTEAESSTLGGIASEVVESVSNTAASFGAPLTPPAGGYTDGAGSIHYKKVPPSKTVYVGNLFFDVTVEDLREEFAQAGTVVDAKIIKDNRGMSKGFGYIEFENTETATNAISTFNGQTFQGRNIHVNYSTPRRGFEGPRRDLHEHPINPPSKTIFIGNISFDMSDRDLNNVFQEIQNVVDVRVAIDRRTGQPRGFAHAEFVDVASAENAMSELRGKVIAGRPLRVDFSVNKGHEGRNRDGYRDGYRESNRESRPDLTSEFDY